jgi:hypothetical protein
MVHLVALALAIAAAPVSPIRGVPMPPEGVVDVELTKAATERAFAEMKTALTQLEKDPSIPEQTKRQIKGKIASLKIAVITTPKSLDETVAFYERQMAGVQFIFAERDVLHDARELAGASGLTLDPEVERTWTGKRGRSARWSREDTTLEIDIEDTLIDPRDAKITKRTIVLLTSLGG